MRTRFAPSPTGFLHVGGLRTALFSYLVAKQTGGEFLVRIEDTDQERSVEGAIENILHTLHWAGLDPDEGVMLREGGIAQEGGRGPYVQSQRLVLYRSYAEKLLADGHAYIAFDTKEEIDRMRAAQAQAGVASPKYDVSVRMNMRNALTMSTQEVQDKLADAEPYVIRMKMPAETQVSFEDDIRGVVSFNTRELDDQVLLKSDGFPTYHLAHVVDDHLMDIGIVIRGEEWLSSLPKHVLLFEAFGWRPPRYAHVPLLLNKDRSKLSKRQSSVAVEEFREKGYMPEAFLNFIALLGWNPGTEQEIFSLPMLIEAFSLDRVQKGGAVFDTEKLDWLQGQWVRQLSTEEFSRAIRPLVRSQFPRAEHDLLFEQRAHLIQERITFLKEAPSMLQYFYEDPVVKNDLLANAKQKITQTMLPDILAFLQETLETVLADEWTQDVLKEKLLSAAKLKGYKHGQVLWPLRAVLTGLPFSPGAFEVAAALGRDTTLARIEMAMQSL